MNDLRDSDLYKMIIDTTNEGIWMIDDKNITTFVNSRMAEMIAYSPDEMIGRPMFNFMDEEGIAIANRNVQRRRNGISELHEFKLLSKEGKEIWTYMNTNPIMDGDNYLGALAMVSDITELKLNEKDQEENYRNYISLFEHSPVPIWDEDFSRIKAYIDELKAKGVKDVGRYFKENNDELVKCTDMLIVNKINKAVVVLNEGESKEQVLRDFRKLVNRRSPEYAICQLEAIANGATFCEFDAELKTFKGNTRYVHFQWAVVKGYEDTYERVYLSTTDMTERIKEENLTLQQSNREKAVLLKEVHHRVKNNLQIITSLLNLQSRTITDPDIKEIFDISLSRINSMATVHELLYKSTNFSRIDFKEYLDSLIHPLIRTMRGDDARISLKLDVVDCLLNINTAIPLGLLINEIITNSLKHGIRHDSEGEIYVKIVRSEDAGFEMSIGDNGVGFDQETAKSKETLGIQLMDSLVDQLSGKLEREQHGLGTHYRIHFREIVQSGL